MIQGNFYERLHFYMDSCAIRPTASLLIEYVINQNDASQVQTTKTKDFFKSIVIMLILVIET